MRPPRLLPPLLVLVLALVCVLVRPLPGRAGPAAKRDGRPRARHRHARHGTRPVHHARGEHGTDLGARVVGYARHLVGIPYRWGGTSPRTGFDCSGLVRYVYAHFGIVLAHSSFADLARGRPVARGRLRPGDLVFFDAGGHVGIYVGRSRFIEAPHTGAVVRISTMGTYGGAFWGARRIR